jgi:hypothetical protein
MTGYLLIVEHFLLAKAAKSGTDFQRLYPKKEIFIVHEQYKSLARLD